MRLREKDWETLPFRENVRPTRFDDEPKRTTTPAPRKRRRRKTHAPQEDWLLLLQGRLQEALAEAEAQAERDHQARLALLKQRWTPVFRRDNGLCWLCGYRVIPKHELLWGTLDHVIPVSKGGSDDLDNLRLAHHYCNKERGSLPPHEAWEKLRDFALTLDPTLENYNHAPASRYRR